jgi:hypothetical protein
MSNNALTAKEEVIEGVSIAPDPEEPGSYLYVPGPPLPETDPHGRPSVQLWLSAESGILQLGARWSVPEATLERIRKQLAERDPTAGAHPSALRLLHAPVTVDAVSLLWGEDRSEPAALASTRSSGAPPFSAIFSVRLDARQTPAAAAALNGNKGRMFVSYGGSRPRTLTITASLSGDVREDVRALADSAAADLDEATRMLARAREAGRLRLDATLLDRLDPAAREEVLRALDSAGASLMLKLAQGTPKDRDLAAASFIVELRRDHREVLPFDIRCDVADWFAGRAATDHIHPLG